MIFLILFAKVLLPPDGGIVYTETNMHRLIPEPLNAISAGFFMLIALYWIIKLNGFSLQSVFLSVASYILLIGSIGGVSYHALRLYKFFILMDWLPILLLCMMASVYFWAKIVRQWLYAAGLILIFFLIQFFIRQYLERYDNLDWAVSINYAAMAIMVIAPVFIYTFRDRSIHSRLVYYSIACFALALFFRESDKWHLLPVGTHFLWHTFGALATQLMFRYVYYLDHERSAWKLKYSGQL